MKLPVNKTVVTQKYKPLTHKGVDLGRGGIKNQKIYSCDEGTVVYNRYQKNSGGYVIGIKHTNGLYSYYGHLKKDTQQVHEGDKVTKGQYIANMGATGKVTGEHLHFAISKKYFKSFVDPFDYVNIYDGQEIKLNGCKCNHTKHCTAECLNVRTKPNTKGEIVFKVHEGEEVETYGLKNKWNIVDNVRGYYCSNNFIK